MKFQGFLLRRNGVIHICLPNQPGLSYCGRFAPDGVRVQEVDLTPENIGYLCLACYRDLIPILVAGDVISSPQR